MYWRVRNVTPEDLMRQYGVHIALIVSILVNVGLFLTRPDPKKNVAKPLKDQFTNFARQVTNHILDNSYVSFEQSTMELLSKELAPSVKQQMMKAELLPKSMDEVKATARTLEQQRQITAVRIDAINQAEPNAQGLIPVEVRGVVAKYSAEESGPPAPQPFTFKFLMGQTKGPDGPEDLRPIVAAFQG